MLNEATELAKDLGCDYVKLWFGQDGWDYPFQVNYHDVWNLAVDGLRELVGAHPDIRFVIEYKPREPRNKIIFPNAARTLLAIQQVGLDNLGILLDFGHSLYGLETPADAAQLCIDHGKLFAIDVNDNFRGWDDDMVVGSVHLVETFEFFHTLRRNNWDGVWQLDQFPFREDSVAAAKDGDPVPQGPARGAGRARRGRAGRRAGRARRPRRPAADPAGAAHLDDRTGRRMTACPPSTPPCRCSAGCRRPPPGASWSPTSPRRPGRSGSRTRSWCTTPAPATSAATSPPSTSWPRCTARC